MDGELERYHKTNSGLDLLISNLKLKQTGLSGEVVVQRRSRTDLEAFIKRMQYDLQQVCEFMYVRACCEHESYLHSFMCLCLQLRLCKFAQLLCTPMMHSTERMICCKCHTYLMHN